MGKFLLSSLTGHGPYRVLFFVGLSVTLSTKSTKFGSRYLVDTSSEREEILHIGSPGLAVHQCWVGELWPPGDPLGAKIHFCNAFLVHRLAESDETWHNEVHWCVADLKGFG